MITTMSNLPTTFKEKLDFTTANYIKDYCLLLKKFTLNFIPNDWKHLLKTKNCQKKNSF